MVDLADLNSDDENSRRFAIMEASRTANVSSLPRLLTLSEIDTYANRRHIVRALGNIGGDLSERRLLELLACEDGLILGDIAGALGKLTSKTASTRLRELEKHEMEWVRQNARAALKALRGKND